MSGIAAWTTFFAALVGASAALSGLVIVAISINLTRILAFPYSLGRAAETLIILVGSLLLSGLMLMPARLGVLGAVGVAVAAVVYGASLYIGVSGYRSRASAPTGSYASRLILGQATTIPMLAGSVMLTTGDSAGLYWLGASALIAVVNAVFATWVLLVEILR